MSFLSEARNRLQRLSTECARRDCPLNLDINIARSPLYLKLALKERMTSLVPWPSDSDLDLRRRLASIEEHQLRTDRLLMEIQLEGRKRAREQEERETAIEEKLTHLIELLTATVSNGHHHE